MSESKNYSKAKAYCDKHPGAFSLQDREHHSIFKELNNKEWSKIKEYINSKIPNIEGLIYDRTSRFQQQYDNLKKQSKFYWKHLSKEEFDFVFDNPERIVDESSRISFLIEQEGNLAGLYYASKIKCRNNKSPELEEMLNDTTEFNQNSDIFKFMHLFNEGLETTKDVLRFYKSTVYIEHPTDSIKQFCFENKIKFEDLHEFLEKKEEDERKKIVKENDWFLDYQEQTPEICLKAVTKDGWDLEFVRDQTPELCLAAVKQNGHCLVCVKNKTKDICEAAIKQAGWDAVIENISDDLRFEFKLKKSDFEK